MTRVSWMLALLALLGCSSEEARFGDAPTFHQDVAPILAERCWSCHTEGKIAPLPLDDYQRAKAAAGAIADATRSGRMPPYHVNASGECQSFEDAQVLSEAQIDTLEAWAAAGAPEGTAAKLPEPRTLPRLDEVSLRLDPGMAYQPVSGRDDDYRCFLVDPGLEDDRFLTGYQVHPGALSQVHHVVLFSVDSDTEASIAQQLDERDAGPGYTCFGGAGTGGGRSLAVWAPGTGATLYPEGTGLRVLAGQPLIMQVHYFRGAQPDRTTIDLALVEEVEREAILTGTLDLSLTLPPGMAEVEQSAALPVPPLDRTLKIYGAYPHMHQYGRRLRVDYDEADSSTCLVDVPDYDFDWQQFFFYREPVEIEPPGAGYFRIRCVYDTRGAEETVHWGEGTEDEMCIAGLYATF